MTDLHEDATAPTAAQPRVPVRPLVLAAVAIAVTVALAAVSTRLTDIVGLTVTAGVVTWLTRPMYCAIQRKIGGAGAVLVTVLASFLILGGLAGAVLWDLNRGASALASDIRTALENVNGRSLLERLVRSLRLGDTITTYLDDLPGNVVFGVDGRPAIAERVVDLTIVVILSAFLHASTTAILNGLVRLWPRPERAQVWDLVGDVDHRAGPYLRGIAVYGVMWSIPFVAIAFAFEMPIPVVIGMWAGMWMMVPRLGWAIGLVPLLLAAMAKPPAPGWISAALAVGVALVARHFRRRLTPTMRPGMAVTVLGLATGVAYSGTASALLWFVLAIVTLAIITSPHRAGMRLPMPAYDEDHAYRWGPIVIPKGFTGVMMTGVVVVVAVLAWSVIGQLGSLVVWLALAMLFAIILDRPTDFLQRKLHLSRLPAFTVVLVGVGAIFAAIARSVISEGPNSAKKALQNLPSVVRKLEDAPVFGGWLRDQNAAQVVTQWLTDLPRRLSQTHGQLNWLPSLSSQLTDVIWIVALTVALAVDGGRLINAIERRVNVRRRRQYRRVIDVSHTALAGYAAGQLLVCTINGSIVLILALVLQLGLAPVLALWAFLWDFVPQIGPFIGALPLCLFALIAGPGPFVIATGVYAIYQLIEANILFPSIIGEAIDIPAWLAMVAVLAGAAAAGLVGAVIVTPLVGVVRMLWVELRTQPVPGTVVTPAVATAGPRSKPPI